MAFHFSPEIMSIAARAEEELGPVFAEIDAILPIIE